MNHFVVVYSNWIALRFSSKGGLKAPKKITRPKKSLDSRPAEA